MTKIQKISKSIQKLAASQRFQSLVVMLLVGITAAVAQNAAGNYEAGTEAISNVADEVAFHTYRTIR